jgi:hypothetical protein
VILGYPVRQRRGHQQQLIRLVRAEGLGHGRIIHGPPFFNAKPGYSDGLLERTTGATNRIADHLRVPGMLRREAGRGQQRGGRGQGARGRGAGVTGAGHQTAGTVVGLERGRQRETVAVVAAKDSMHFPGARSSIVGSGAVFDRLE